MPVPRIALFSPAGRSAERRRGDEGAERTVPEAPSSGPSGHLLPAGEKRERTWRRSALQSVLLFFALLLAPLPALAVDPSERLADPKLEQRARDLSANLRCMVCQNQSIDDSNADLARDLRLLVRERIVSGDSDEQVINYVVSRYGEFVLLKPRLSAKTLILWGAPAFLLVIGLGVAIVYARGRSRPEPKRLSDEEEARLGKLLDE
ncbi:cytochrome c-type biogenesis protein CcmH [Rhizobium sp. KAs_5_22]|nr:cytochrome c-type biogenesis protein CcmH [Rhizobium sp. KAs_5_22]